jgi:hypothetical protein
MGLAWICSTTIASWRLSCQLRWLVRNRTNSWITQIISKILRWIVSYPLGRFKGRSTSSKCLLLPRISRSSPLTTHPKRRSRRLV